MKEIKLHLLVEPKMEPIPADLEVIIFDGDLRIVDEHGMPLATGKHVGLNGNDEAIKRWLRPFARVWVGKGSPALEEFEVCDIR